MRSEVSVVGTTWYASKPSGELRVAVCALGVMSQVPSVTTPFGTTSSARTNDHGIGWPLGSGGIDSG